MATGGHSSASSERPERRGGLNQTCGSKRLFALRVRQLRIRIKAFCSLFKRFKTVIRGRRDVIKGVRGLW